MARAVQGAGYRVRSSRRTAGISRPTLEIRFAGSTVGVGVIRCRADDAVDAPSPSGRFQGTSRFALPFVARYRASWTLGFVEAAAVYEDLRCQVFFDQSASAPSRGGKIVPYDFRRDLLPQAEALARTTMAIFARRDARIGAETVQGRAVESLTVRGRVFVRSDRLPNVGVRREPRRHLVRLTSRGREVLLPVGSNQARVDGDWRDLHAICPLNGGTLYVPLDLARWVAGG